MTSATQTPAAVAAVKSPKEQFLDGFERETATTLKVLKAYPESQSELRPHEKLKTARELAAMFTMEMALVDKVVRGTYAFPPKAPPVPETWSEVIDAFERDRTSCLEGIRQARDEDLLTGKTTFMVGPKKTDEWPTMEFLWFLLCDQIHHRGQLSVYLRLAGGKVPSIYGPSADEPWF
jgi:uncharacterized damage-inducible protein DinB